MNRSLNFRAFGVQVRIELSFLLVSLLLGGIGVQSTTEVSIWVVIVAGSVLIHEAGHATVFRLCGVRSAIRLFAMGGVTIPQGGRELSAPQWLAVSLAGPAAGFLAGGLTLLLVSATGGIVPGSLTATAVGYLIWVNLGWGLINLLPIIPLDGGHALEALLARLPRAVAEDLSQAVSLVTVVVVSVLAYANGFALMPLVLGWFWFGGVTAWWQRRSAQRDMPDATVLDAVRARILDQRAPPAADRAAAIKTAEASTREVLLSVRSQRLRYFAWENLALIALVSQRDDLAAEVLDHVGNDFNPQPGLLARLLLLVGRPAEALPYLYQVYAASPGDEVGALIVRALIATGSLDDAISFVNGPQSVHLGKEAEAALATGKSFNA